MTNEDITQRAQAAAVRAFDTEGADAIGLGVECESRWRRFAERTEEVVQASLELEQAYIVTWNAAYWSKVQELWIAKEGAK